MRRYLKCLVAGAAILAGSHSQSWGQEAFQASSALEGEGAPHPPRRASNAAIAYWNAWDTIKTQPDRTAFGEAMGARPKPGEKLTKAQRQVLEKHRDFIEGVLAATAMEDCDWGSRYDLGFGAMLPHLGHLRNSARALGCDARRCIEDNNPVGAAERVVAIFRLARHAAEDRILISTLVGNAIGVLAAIVTDEMVKQQELNPVAAGLILKGMKENIGKDLYNTGASIDVERTIVIGWFRSQATGPNAGEKLGKLVNEASSMQGNSLKVRMGVFMNSWNEQQVANELDRAERYFDAIKLAWAKPNASVALAELETQAWEGQWGLVVQATSGQYSTVRRSVNRSLAHFERTMGKLRGVVEVAGAEVAPAGKS